MLTDIRYQDTPAPSLQEQEGSKNTLYFTITRNSLPTFSQPAALHGSRHPVEQSGYSAERLEQIRQHAIRSLFLQDKEVKKNVRLKQEKMREKRVMNEWHAEWDESEQENEYRGRNSMVGAGLLLEPSRIDLYTHAKKAKNVPLSFYGGDDEAPNGTKAQVARWNKIREEKDLRLAAPYVAAPPRTALPSQEYQQTQVKNRFQSRQYTQQYYPQLPFPIHGYHNTGGYAHGHGVSRNPFYTHPQAR